MSFLKIDPKNHLNFHCQDYNNRIISVEDEYQKQDLTNYYDSIYKIKIHEVTLRELLIMQSFYLC